MLLLYGKLSHMEAVQNGGVRISELWSLQHYDIRMSLIWHTGSVRWPCDFTWAASDERNISNLVC